MKKIILMLGIIIASPKLNAAIHDNGYDSATDDFPPYDKTSTSHEHKPAERRETCLLSIAKTVSTEAEAATRIQALLSLGRKSPEKAPAVDIALWIMYQRFPKLFNGYSQAQSWDEETP